MKFNLTGVSYLCLLLATLTAQANPKVVPPPATVALKCEHMVNPLGVDAVQPRLSWKMQDHRRAATQTGYRIIIGKDSLSLVKKKGEVWDTRKVQSNTNLVRYAGKPLEAFSKYYWLVEVWDKDGKALPSSAIASFETGMLQMSNWKLTKNWLDNSYWKKIVHLLLQSMCLLAQLHKHMSYQLKKRL